MMSDATTTEKTMSGTGRTVLGILQCGHAPEELLGRFRNYPDMFVELLGRDAFDYRSFRVVDGEFPAGADDADAWLITGSRHGVYEPHGWIPPLERLIREIAGVEPSGEPRPLVGICFGHQIIARALGGRVEKFAGGWSIGRVEYRLDAAPSPLPPGAPLMAYHQDQVIEPPPGAVTLGSSDVCRHAALAIGPRILTLQPHPEFDAAFVEGLLETRGHALAPETRERARASLREAGDVDSARARVGRALRDFLQGRASEVVADGPLERSVG